MRIAIMQPYFFPYAGYFRLFAAADLFVIYDCVQFIRRGWIHRNRFLNSSGDLDWLTLPLKKAPRDILIKDLMFSEEGDREWQKRLRSFPLFLSREFQENKNFLIIHQLNLKPVDYIISTMKLVCELLKLPFNIVKSSELNLPTTLKGQDRIIEIARHFQAKQYINLSGGRDLYDENTFKNADLQLHFLVEYRGSFDSILQRLLKDENISLQKEIIEQSIVNKI